MYLVCAVFFFFRWRWDLEGASAEADDLYESASYQTVRWRRPVGERGRGRERSDEIYWVPLCGITFPVMEPRVDNKNKVLTVETSVMGVINIFGCGGYKLKKRIQFKFSAATFFFFRYLSPVLAACILATRPLVFVNKSLSSWPQRLIKGQYRRSKTTDVALLIAEKHFIRWLEKWRHWASLFCWFCALLDTQQVCRSR